MNDNIYLTKFIYQNIEYECVDINERDTFKIDKGKLVKKKDCKIISRIIVGKKQR